MTMQTLHASPYPPLLLCANLRLQTYDHQSFQVYQLTCTSSSRVAVSRMDKASMLSNAVSYINELKSKVDELESQVQRESKKVKVGPGIGQVSWSRMEFEIHHASLSYMNELMLQDVMVKAMHPTSPSSPVSHPHRLRRHSPPPCRTRRLCLLIFLPS
ncbi:hypothetical protein ACFX1Q_034552 [Malus domestica]